MIETTKREKHMLGMKALSKILGAAATGALALGLMSSAASAHVHHMETPGTTVTFKCEPFHGTVPGQIPDSNPNVYDTNPASDVTTLALHPVHQSLHKGRVGELLDFTTGSC